MSGSELPNTPRAFAWYFLKRQKWLLLLCTFCAISVNAGIPIALYNVGKIVDTITAPDIVRETIWDKIMPYVVMMIFAWIVMDAIPSRIRSYTRAFIEYNLVGDIKKSLSRYLFNHPLIYFQNDFAGRLATKVNEPARKLFVITRTIIGEGFDAIVTILISSILFMSIHWIFGLIVLIWATAFCIFTGLTVPRIHKISYDFSEQNGILIGRLVDILTNISSVFSYANIENEKKHFDDQIDVTRKIKLRYALFTSTADLFKEFMWQFLCSPMVILMIILWQKGYVTAGEITMMIPLLISIARQVWTFSSSLIEVFAEYGEFCDCIDTIMVSQTDRYGNKTLPVLKKPAIHIDNVSFRYNEMADDEILFQDYNLKINSGQKVGLIGPSGAGKSTLVNLLTRFFVIQEGEIKLGNQNISDVTQESLRQNIAVIPQDTSLFHRSLMDNIRYGRLDATDEEVIEASKKAHAHEFISELPDGYETLVGERGVKLSGGQRQRIAIARAILKDAPILILDEATSALDSESEKLIQESLHELMEGKTVIAIAHRLSTIAHLDRLIVMDQGKIVEDGSHKSLLKKDGLYAKLWNMQSGGFLGE